MAGEDDAVEIENFAFLKFGAAEDGDNRGDFRVFRAIRSAGAEHQRPDTAADRI